ncbi:hypothetical protein B296_00027927 [Ensete ventricosum]|uniref:Uncharacterized protein n=1 Tax=Ensete ventricosum TaxID=4639 RepID=A0A426Z050_ENSVE|nr:hypothetical protein B296_00027927 [Ensete ventricosum]
MELYVVAKKVARISSACVHKLIRIGREEARKLKRDRLGLLGNAPRLGPLGSALGAPPFRSLLRDSARRPRRGGGARCGPSDDQVSVLTEIVLRVQYRERVSERASFSRVAFILTGLGTAVPGSLLLSMSFTELAYGFM